MAASFATTQTFTSGQKNVSHVNLNAIVTGLSVTNIGSAELASDGVAAVNVNADVAGIGLEQAADGSLQLIGAGYRALALTNANVTLTRSTDKRNQEFSGTLTGAVVINLSRSSAVAGDQFDIFINSVITTASFTFTLQENGSGALWATSLAKNCRGSLIAKYDGSAWKLTQNTVLQS